MGILNEEERNAVESAISPGNVVMTTVARMYTSSNNGPWTYSKIIGAVTLVKTDISNYIKIVDLHTKSVKFEQEIYKPAFPYEEAKPFFHCFESDSSVVGLSFADASEAHDFFTAVKDIATPEKPPRPSHPGATPAHNKAAPPPPPTGSKPPPPPIKRREITPASTTPAEPKPEQQRAPSPKHEPEPASSTAQSQASSNSAPKKQGSFFGRMLKMVVGEEEDTNIDISAPEKFEHRSHIGWDPEAGFEIKNIPPEWRKLFQAAGVKKRELKDADTAKLLMQVINDNTGGGMDLGGGASSSGGAPPPPPPPPPPGAGGKAPPPPPAPKAGSPAPAPTGRANLLAQIEKGTALKKVDPAAADHKAPDVNSAEGKSLVGALANAMASRRVELGEDEVEEEEEEVWSD